MKKYKVVIELNEEEYKKYKRLIVMAFEKKEVKRHSGTELFKKVLLDETYKKCLV